ncbi:3-hydroxyacyl-ACP dehydratase FabZ [Candidatus Bipolaricaulota bacterium]|nr:3-hydroxyacyl-ACP dehydratase FabZ [Candidatus Bipolaricaulota bacterium]
MDIEEIKDNIALRYPYLLVDRIIDIDGDEVKGIKNVTINEPFFQGHFPDPGPSVMPGTMIIEAMAQVAGVLVAQGREEDGLGYLVGVDEARFRKKVKPGDQLLLEAKLKRKRSSIRKVRVEAKVEEELASEAEITLAFDE